MCRPIDPSSMSSGEKSFASDENRAAQAACERADPSLGTGAMDLDDDPASSGGRTATHAIKRPLENRDTDVAAKRRRSLDTQQV